MSVKELIPDGTPRGVSITVKCPMCDKPISLAVSVTCRGKADYNPTGLSWHVEARFQCHECGARLPVEKDFVTLYGADLCDNALPGMIESMLLDVATTPSVPITSAWKKYFEDVDRVAREVCGIPESFASNNETGFRSEQLEKNMAAMFKEIDNGVLCHKLAAIAIYARKLLFDNDSVSSYAISIIDNGLDEYFKRYPDSSLKKEY